MPRSLPIIAFNASLPAHHARFDITQTALELEKIRLKPIDVLHVDTNFKCYEWFGSDAMVHVIFLLGTHLEFTDAPCGIQ